MLKGTQVKVYTSTRVMAEQVDCLHGAEAKAVV